MIAPLDPFALPAVHCTQLDDPEVAWKDPVEQVEHEVDPAAEYDPAPQMPQLAEEVAPVAARKVPATQGVHAVAFPSA